MADIADTLKSILGDGAEDKIKNVMGSLTAPADGGEKMAPSVDMGQIMQLRSMVEAMTMNRSDPRTSLLLSLKPYMSGKRSESIDSAVKLMGVWNILKTLTK